MFIIFFSQSLNNDYDIVSIKNNSKYLSDLLKEDGKIVLVSIKNLKYALDKCKIYNMHQNN